MAQLHCLCILREHANYFVLSSNLQCAEMAKRKFKCRPSLFEKDERDYEENQKEHPSGLGLKEESAIGVDVLPARPCVLVIIVGL